MELPESRRREVARPSVVRGPPPPHRRFQAFLAKGVAAATAAVAMVAAAIYADTLPIDLSSHASPPVNAVALFPSGCIYGFLSFRGRISHVSMSKKSNVTNGKTYNCTILEIVSMNH